MPLTDRPRDHTARADGARWDAEKLLRPPVDADAMGVALVHAVLSLAAEVAALRATIEHRPWT
jgi:hypothetical protein